MSLLLTPPATSHRDKENRPLVGSRVAWSAHNVYHTVTGSPTRYPEPPSTNKAPLKSILKKTSYQVLPLQDADLNNRETTPEPLDPRSDVHYLEHPVSRIISPDASLRDLVEAYSILAARIKAVMVIAPQLDISWALFQPMKNNMIAFVDAIIRDVGKALVDPTFSSAGLDLPEDECLHLPSPRSSPKRKKGMSAEQVKHARDLCTTCHAVLKLLGLVLALPPLSHLLSDTQLAELLTQVLAIPLAPELPTPNARKTYALAIWVLQVQRLPSKLLVPARNRITYALRRGIEGELGKEGKKGSASDGLKAVHELSVYQPSTFVPAFAELIPSVFANLLASTMALRVQACHALGGFVMGLTSQRYTALHTRVSEMACSFLLTTAPAPDPEILLPLSETCIIRTLRTTLIATEPPHVAQGPIWALCVLASLIVLIGGGFRTNSNAMTVIQALLNLARRHENGNVRLIACIVWRCFVWTYFRPPLPEDDDDEDQNKDSDCLGEKETLKYETDDDYFKIVVGELEGGTGTAMIAALLGHHADGCIGYDEMWQVLFTLNSMIHAGGVVCSEAVDVLWHMAKVDAPTPKWDDARLLARPIFTAYPGLLSAEFNALQTIVKPMYERCMLMGDVRPLTREEIQDECIYNRVIEMWIKIMRSVTCDPGAPLPTKVTMIWKKLLGARLTIVQDNEEQLSVFARKSIRTITTIIEDPRVTIAHAEGTTRLGPKPELKLPVVHGLWKAARDVIPHQSLNKWNHRLLETLLEVESDLPEDADEGRRQWALFCADVLACDIEEMETLWGNKVNNGDEKPRICEKSLAVLWGCFAARWRADADATWEGSLFLLGVPFVENKGWNLSNDECDAWEELLRFTVEKGEGAGIEASDVLDHVADSVAHNDYPASASHTRVADLLITHLDITCARQLPDFLFAYINDVLVSSYPPEPKSKITSMWLIRSFTRVVDACPIGLVSAMLEMVQDGLCVWLTDEHECVCQDDYTFNVLPLYQTLLVSLRSLPLSIETLETFSPILSAPFCGRPYVIAVAIELFGGFWSATFAQLHEPARRWPGHIQACLNSVHNKNNEKCADDAMTHSDTAQQESVIARSLASGAAPQDKRNAVQDNEEQNQIVVLQDSLSNNKLEDVFGEKICDTPCVLAESDVPEPDLPITPNESIYPSTPVIQRPESPSAICPIRTPKSYMTPSSSGFLVGISRLVPPMPRTSVLRDVQGFTACVEPASHLSGIYNLGRSDDPCLPDGSSDEDSWPDLTVERTPLPMSLGKRHRRNIEDAAGRVERAAKKGKTEATSTQAVSPPPTPADDESESEDERRVVENLVKGIAFYDATTLVGEVFGTASTSTMEHGKMAPIPCERIRRPGVFMDAVELPTMDLIRSRNRHNKKVRGRALIDRGYISETEAVVDEPVAKSGRLKRRSDNVAVVTHRRRKIVTSPPCSEVDSSLCEAEEIESEASSDDGPHLGQVTPDHLTSPEPRWFECDPPSDDSIVSPTRDVAARRRSIRV